jgi:large conductance mechanosensitive channel
MGLLKEFREFAVKGNMIDLAVGVVIGGAFGKIVNSLVENVIMPPLNLLTRKYGVEFKQLALKSSFELPVKNADGSTQLDAESNPVMRIQEVAVLNYGAFVQTVVDFLIIAIAIFAVVKLINSTKKRFEREAEEAAPALPSEEVLLLREIRDELRGR